MKKNSFYVSIMFFLVILILGCNVDANLDTGATNIDSGVNTNRELGRITHSSVIGAKTVFIDSIPAKNKYVSRSPKTDINALCCFIDGVEKPLVFETSEDNSVVLDVSLVKKISSSIIGIQFDVIYEINIDENDESIELIETYYKSYNALVDLQTGIFYDMSNYSLEDCFLFNNFLFVRGNNNGNNSSTVYKICIDNISTAIPLNNSSFIPCTGISCVLKEKLVIESEYGNIYTLDINGTSIPKKLSPILLGGGAYVGLFPNGDYPIERISDENGTLWVYYFNFYNSVGGDTRKYYRTAKIDLDNDGNIILLSSERKELSFNCDYDDYVNYLKYLLPDNKILLITNKGFVKLQINSQGIQVDDTAVDMGGFGRGYINHFLYNNYLYWINDTKICRQELVSGSQEEIFYEDSKIINNFNYNNGGNVITYINQKIFFSMFEDALTVGFDTEFVI